MVALIIVLNAVDYLDDILSGFVREEISGATILDSQGMGSAIVNGNHRSIPIFNTLHMLLNDSHPYNKTIFTVLENDKMVERAVAVVQNVLEGVSCAGFMFTIPIGNVYPINQE